MNPLPPAHVIHTDPSAGDSSLSTQNDEEENRSVNSASFSHYSHTDHSLPNPNDYFEAETASKPTPQKLQFHEQQQQQQQQSSTPSTPTPRHSNRSRNFSNSEAVTNATRTGIAAMDDPASANQLIIRITTRPIMSWSPQVIHADGSSHTMTIDLPEEFARNNTTRVITQQGWQDLYHIVATAVAKNTSESILLFWISGFLLMVMAFILLFRFAKGISARLGLLLGVLGVTSFCGIAHSVVRRFRVQTAVRKCVEECFYDAEAAALANAAAIGVDIEQQQQQQQQQQQLKTQNNNDNIPPAIGRDDMGGNLDGLQELEDVANVDVANVGETIGGGGFGRALRQRLHSHSSTHSHSHPVSIVAAVTRQRLNTGGGESSVASSSNMIFDEGPNRNRAVSRDGMYYVDWEWEFLGMDAVVRISWE
mmetsp:Transcript_52532/g.107761  ORF Transcript_52532/g.107761 Transcript_52532/m.107761 type:complete len:422 (-) Transcript_52532:93-1358(-)